MLSPLLVPFMFRNRPYYFKLVGMLLALVVCIGLIWLLMRHPSVLFSMGR